MNTTAATGRGDAAHNGPRRDLPPVLELAPTDDFAIYAYAPHLLLPPSSTPSKPKMSTLMEVSEADTAADSPFRPPYHIDSYAEHPVIELTVKAKAVLEGQVHSLHQEELMYLVRKANWCPEPLPFFLHPNCPPSDTELVRSERIHTVLQLLAQLREQQHQALLRRVYKTFGFDHRKAAKELYARELFSTAYTQYWSLYTCLSCDQCLKLTPFDRHNTTVDLLEKLAVTCLRAGWLADAEKFSNEALKHEHQSTRARVWLATAQLGLGNLDGARRNLALLPPRGEFPPSFPAWIEPRVMAQRAVLARLDREAAGKYDLVALARDPPHATPAGPHFTNLCAVQRMPRGFRTRTAVVRGALLLVAHPVVCVPCCTAATATANTLHAEDPPLLTLALLADAVYTQAKILPQVRAPLLAAGTRADTAVVDLVGNNLRAAAIFVAQTYSVAIPHVQAASATVMRPTHAGHALYLPLLDLRSGSPANTCATFCGPHLFLRAAQDLQEGVLLTFDGFDRNVSAPQSTNGHEENISEDVKTLLNFTFNTSTPPVAATDITLTR